MAKRNLFWHIGPTDGTSALLAQALQAAGADRDDLHTLTALEARDADLDLRRAHASAGLRRSDVDGAWSRLESKVWHVKGSWVVSTPAAHLADEDQRRLAMDGLRGIRTHLVVLRTPANTAEVDRILERWTLPLHPERVLVRDVDGSAQDAWDALLDAAGLSSQPWPESVAQVRAGTPAATLLERTTAQHAGRPDVVAAQAELLAPHHAAHDETAAALAALASASERLAASEAEIARLLAENERLDRKRRKHKRRLRALQAELGDDPEAA